MKRILKYGCVLSIVAIVGCGSDDDDGGGNINSAASAIQGEWEGPCEADIDGDSEQFDLLFSGNNLSISNTIYTDSVECSSEVALSFNQFSTFIIDGTETALADGNATHIDLISTGGSITASPAFIDELDSQGTTLAAFIAALGTTGDINNLSNADLGITQAENFEIFRIDGNLLTFGDTDGSFTGDTAALRPVSLDTAFPFMRVP